MACFVNFFLIFSLNFLIHGTVSHKPILPKAAIFPVTKDSSTLQYVTQLFMGQNQAPVKAVIDLGGPFLWVNCEDPSLFSHKQVPSCSLQCSMAESSGCVGFGGTCTVQAENGFLNISAFGEVNEGKIGVKFWDEVNLGSVVDINNFLFLCAPKYLLGGLAKGAIGMLGLGNSRISLPPQFSSAFGFFNRKFSIYLSSSNGAIFLGGSPFEDISTSMMYTPLTFKKSSVQEGYYINVESIKISGKKLSISQKGFDGGTKISTTVPYTTMESKLYSTFVDAYIKAATSKNMTLVAPMAPFDVCFTSSEGENKRVAPNGPIIDLVLQSELVKWRILGRNSLVRVSDEVMCLAFFDGGLKQKDPIIIGGFQMEDYILEFNLGNSMLGFSPSLVMGKNKCSDFDAFISKSVS